MTSSIDLRAAVLLAIQRALLGEVVISLRLVGVSWSDKEISARFVFDRADDAHAERVAAIETEVSVHFEPEIPVKFRVEVAAPPTQLDIRPDMAWAYSRAETDDGRPVP
jgi:hypothetical protein